jgi:TetR/AcrR family acrAB operon transcriptional repressor
MAMVRRTAEDAAKTREAILDAALHVFAERGFAAAQLEDIARRADVTRGALYHHFSNKVDLYLAVLKERWDTAMTPVLQQLRGRKKPTARLHAFVAAFVRSVRSDPRMKALMEMSISGDVKLPEFQHGMADKSAALELWTKEVSSVLEEAGHVADAHDRAMALVTFLNGVAVATSLYPDASALEPERLARFALEGILG